MITFLETARARGFLMPGWASHILQMQVPAPVLHYMVMITNGKTARWLLKNDAGFQGCSSRDPGLDLESARDRFFVVLVSVAQ